MSQTSVRLSRLALFLQAVLIALVWISNSISYAQGSPGEKEGTLVDCVTDMMIPAYGHVARRSKTGGSVRAVVTVGSSGAAEAIHITSVDEDLADEVRAYLKNATTYNPGCGGKQVNLLFTFELSGEPQHDPPVWVRFLPPNRFIIMSRPHRPNID